MKTSLQYLLVGLCSLLLAACSSEPTQEEIRQATPQDNLAVLLDGNDHNVMQLARLLDCQPGTLLRIEKGSSTPTEALQQKIVNLRIQQLHADDDISFFFSLDPEKELWYNKLHDFVSSYFWWLMGGLLFTLLCWLLIWAGVQDPTGNFRQAKQYIEEHPDDHGFSAEEIRENLIAYRIPEESIIGFIKNLGYPISWLILLFCINWGARYYYDSVPSEAKSAPIDTKMEIAKN